MATQVGFDLFLASIVPINGSIKPVYRKTEVRPEGR